MVAILAFCSLVYTDWHNLSNLAGILQPNFFGSNKLIIRILFNRICNLGLFDDWFILSFKSCWNFSVGRIRLLLRNFLINQDFAGTTFQPWLLQPIEFTIFVTSIVSLFFFPTLAGILQPNLHRHESLAIPGIAESTKWSLTIFSLNHLIKLSAKNFSRIF